MRPSYNVETALSGTHYQPPTFFLCRRGKRIQTLIPLCRLKTGEKKKRTEKGFIAERTCSSSSRRQRQLPRFPSRDAYKENPTTCCPQFRRMMITDNVEDQKNASFSLFRFACSLRCACFRSCYTSSSPSPRRVVRRG